MHTEANPHYENGTVSTLTIDGRTVKKFFYVQRDKKNDSNYSGTYFFRFSK